MKKRKYTITILILCIILLGILAGIIWCLRKEKVNNQNYEGSSQDDENYSNEAEEENENTDNENTINTNDGKIAGEVNKNIEYEISQGDTMILPTNIQSIFTDERSQTFDLSMFGKTYFRFIYDTLEKIHTETKDLSEEEIDKYYKINQSELGSKHINTEEDFYMLASSINEIKKDDENANFQSSVADTNSVVEDEKKFSFNILMTYSNNKTIPLKVTTYKNEYKVSFGEEFGLTDVINKYTGNVTRTEIVKFMNTLENTAIPAINKMAEKKSDNAILEQYDTQKNLLNSYGFYDANSYFNFATQVITTRWGKGAALANVTSDVNTITNDGTYTSFDVTLSYTTGDTIHFKLNIANDSDTSPEIKIVC